MNQSPKLAYVNSKGNAVIRVDYKSDLAWGEKRRSVRIVTKDRLQKGQMVVLAA